MNHSHLTRQRLPKGECPACDVEWEAQAESSLRAIRARLTESAQVQGKFVAGTAPWPLCLAVSMSVRVERATKNTHNHICTKRPEHPGAHYCLSCNEDWQD